MTIKLPEKTWFTFHELMERWQCTENDIRRLVIEQTLIPSIRTSEKLTYPDWEFEPSGKFVPSGRIGESSSEGYALEFTVLNHWLYLRLPLRISTFDCEFRLCSFKRDSPEPKTPDDVMSEGIDWSWIPEAMTLKNVISNAAFLLEEVARFETNHSKHDQEEIPEKPLRTTERNNLLKLVIGMAVKGYSYEPAAKKSPTPKEIADDLAALEISIDPDTVRKYLKEAANTVLPANARQS